MFSHLFSSSFAMLCLHLVTGTAAIIFSLLHFVVVLGAPSPHSEISVTIYMLWSSTRRFPHLSVQLTLALTSRGPLMTKVTGSIQTSHSVTVSTAFMDYWVSITNPSTISSMILFAQVPSVLPLLLSIGKILPSLDSTAPSFCIKLCN